MLVKNQKVKINWNASNKAYYVSKGYPFTKMGDEFEVRIEDLLPKSKEYILVRCDYCGIPFMKRYANYNIGKEKYGIDDKDCCDDCLIIKKEERCLSKYGVKNYTQTDEFKERYKQTCQEKYGVDNVSQIPEIAEKISQSRTKEFKDLTGITFNHLTVISLVPNKTNKHHDRYWLCECDCENKTRKEISEHHLIRGNTKSCGCIRKESLIERWDGKTKKDIYPYYKEIYCTYDSMRKRCCNEKHDNYKRYGGRGIIICDEWLNDFMKFYNWAIENDYKEGLTIERIDYDGNYEPNNCKWATWEEQSYNKSNTLYIEVDSEMKTTKQWSDETGIPQYIIYQRYARYRKKDKKELELLTKEKFFKPVRKIHKKENTI